ncbi:hypothetical protein PsYK624_158450 [Phanerochaete sordida]|uniref:Uncharacterized protein n=1 Tax=Phanerochaete sordida TaxID=48140 RepID=A0A9P3GR80_9APHY|nr:hypothetical protein PsYK624_158450 [Phanerochaete sordida]
MTALHVDTLTSRVHRAGHLHPAAATPRTPTVHTPMVVQHDAYAVCAVEVEVFFDANDNLCHSALSTAKTYYSARDAAFDEASLKARAFEDAQDVAEVVALPRCHSPVSVSSAGDADDNAGPLENATESTARTAAAERRATELIEKMTKANQVLLSLREELSARHPGHELEDYAVEVLDAFFEAVEYVQLPEAELDTLGVGPQCMQDLFDMHAEIVEKIRGVLSSPAVSLERNNRADDTTSAVGPPEAIAGKLAEDHETDHWVHVDKNHCHSDEE